MGFDIRFIKPNRLPLTARMERIVSEGTVILTVRFGMTPSKMMPIEFTVVDVPMAYNAILGLPSLTATQAVVSPYQKVKFPTGNGIGELLGDQAATRICYVQATKMKAPPIGFVDNFYFRIGDEEIRHDKLSAKPTSSMIILAK